MTKQSKEKAASSLRERLVRAEESAAEYRAIFENCQVGIIVVDGDRNIRRINGRALEIFGYDSPDEVIGRNVQFGHADREAYERFGKRYFETLREGENLHVRFHARRRDGTMTWCRVSGKAIDSAVPSDLSQGVVWIVDDINDLVESQEHLEHLARYDSLTQLAKKHHFYERAEEEMARSRRYGRELSLLMIDIDHFKRVNDTYGHITGDETLARVCERIRAHIREADLAGRLGGEEFAILLPETGSEEAFALAERLRKIIGDAPIETERAELGLTVSIGVARLNPVVADVAAFIHNADQALYQAKDRGRNRVEMHEG